MSWQHRPALDGMRTIAVYLVLLFHCGVSWLEGGFIGVDLFFVLSGFLVSSILLEELHVTGRLDLGRFYARRVRRLLPAAVVVVVVTSAVFLLIAPLLRRVPWVGDAQASLLYVANWRFLGQSNDYFGADIDKSPFLHFWSLSIEEQFYFVFPLLLVLLFKLQKRWNPALVTGILVLLVASVAAQLFWAPRNLNHAYYGTDTRLYQLLAGVLAAMAWRRFRERSRPVPGAAWVFAVALLVAATTLLPVSPSVRGLVATVASVGLIVAIMTESDRPVIWFLTRPVNTYLGRISYGTYLWHWPVILVLTEVLEVSPWVLAALAGAVATGLAALSFEILEQPIRRSVRLAPINFPTLLTGVTCSAVVAFTLVPALLNQDRLPVLVASSEGATAAGARNVDGPVPQGIDWLKFASDEGPENTHCSPDDLTSCIVHTGSSGLDVVLVGDSHGRILASTITDLARKHDFTLSLNLVGGCPWQQGLVSDYSPQAEQDECTTARNDLYDSLLEDMDIDVVILTQMPRDGGTWTTMLHPAGASGLDVDLDQLNLTTIDETLATITAAGAKAVIVEGMLMTSDLDNPNPLECLSAAARTSECRVPVPLTPPMSDSFFRTAAVESPDVSTISINDLMCPATPVCEPLMGGIPVWRDGKHYSPPALESQEDGIWEKLAATSAFDAAD